MSVNFPLRTALPDPVPVQLTLLEVGKESSCPPGSRTSVYLHQVLTEHLLCTWQ